LYWLSFLLCWVVLPVASTYFDSSEFTVKGKLCYAIKLNLLIYSLGAGGLVIFVIYYVLRHKTFQFDGIFAFLMAWANAFGLVQIIFFLSNGLIAGPRALHREARARRTLDTVCCQLVQVSEIIDDRRLAIERGLRETQAVEILATSNLKPYIAKIYELIPNDVHETLANSSLVDPQQYLDSPRDCGYKRIVRLHYNLKLNLYELSAYTK
jgi:hypothetical protein